MRNVFIIILLAMSILLVACSDSTESNTVDEVSEDKSEIEEVNSEEVKEKEIKTINESPKDIESIFIKMAESSKDIKSVIMSGKSNNETTMAGVTDKESVEIVGEVTLVPYTQHLTLTSVSGEGEDAEIYLVDGVMYMNSSDSDGWIKMNMSLDIMEMVRVLEESQLEHLSNNKDAFELTDDGDNYVITYVGSDDMYKEIFYNEVMQSSEFANSFGDMIEGMDVTGSMEMKVSKDTFYVVEQTVSTNTKMNLHGEVEMHTIDEGVYSFTDYNKIDTIVVPEEVINTAQEIPGM